ncbi:MAG: sigma 54-interacting transcriptional regulator [Burkholderiaceae bacterium]
MPDSEDGYVGPGEAAQLWNRALNRSESAVAIIEPSRDRVLQFNRALAEVTGLAGHEIKSLAASGLFPNQIAELTAFTIECMDRGTAWTSELALRRRDGQQLPVEVFASHTLHDGRDLIFLQCFDLKKNKVRRAKVDIDQFYRSGQPQENRFEAVFRELERGNQLILHAAGEGIYGVDARGRLTFVNPAAERMLGWKENELIGQNGHSLLHHSYANGDPYPHHACPIYAAFEESRIFKVDDEVFWRKDGTSFPVEYTSTPIQEKGRALGAVVVFRDVTEQKKASAQLQGALKEVEALKLRLEQENAYLKDELHSGNQHHEIVGGSQRVRHIISQIELVAPTDASVLITGQSGTGKELIARAIHYASHRADRPLIRVNCASIPRDLFESEFFGHVRGAFTGAVAQRVGRFELADGGTIFLDEVGEIPLEQQGKLLRILQEQQFERVGDPVTRQIDVRVIAATNRDLQEEVAQRRFREDLYFRLNVFPIHSPPLNERLEDIGQLASLFVRRVCAQMNKPELSISVADVERMKRYAWPGNIRELQNLIERAVIISTGNRLRLDIPASISVSSSAAVRERVTGAEKMDAGIDAGIDAEFDTGPGVRTADGFIGVSQPDNPSVLTESEGRLSQRDNLLAALRQCQGKVSGTGGAARLLGLKPTTLYSRIKRHQIDVRQFKSTS